jgi:hypothetical protein
MVMRNQACRAQRGIGASVVGLVLACGAAWGLEASAQIEPILFSDAPIPGVMQEAPAGSGQIVPGRVFQTGLYRPRNSPDKTRWAIRVNGTGPGGGSINDNEYIVSGSGLTGQTVVHSTLDAAMVPPASVPVFFISERGLSINDSGNIALSGHRTVRAQTDTIWFVQPGVSASATVVAARGLPRPAVEPPLVNPQPIFNQLSAPVITNTNKVAFGEEDGLDQALLWDAGSWTSLKDEGSGFTNPELAGRFFQENNSGEANVTRGSVFYFENPGEPGVFGMIGYTDNTLPDFPRKIYFSAREPAGDRVIAIEGGSVAGRALGNQPIGWIDAAGNTYVVSNNSADMYAILNGAIVAETGGLVGGNVPGERWISAIPASLHPSVLALDRNAAGGYIIGGMTDNTASFAPASSSAPSSTPAQVLKNQVIIYVAPDGSRTELVRNGDPVTVVVNGVPQTRRIVTLGQQDASIASFVNNQHMYFLAGTDPFAGAIPDDLFARVALPAVSTPAVVCCRGSTCATVASAADCSAPAGVVVGAAVSPATACGVSNSAMAGCCYADFNKLGGVTIDDIFIYLNAWFAASEFANVGEPGAPNIDDIFIYLNAWFAGC